MCWISAIRSVGGPGTRGLGGGAGLCPQSHLRRPHVGDGPHRGCGGDPQDPGHSAGVGAQARVSHPTHTLPGVALTFGSCVRTQCV